MDIKKIIAKLPVGYAEDAAGMNGDQLRAEIVRAETSLRWVQQEMKADEKLTGARELMKDLSVRLQRGQEGPARQDRLLAPRARRARRARRRVPTPSTPRATP
jgi:hypothetical protein